MPWWERNKRSCHECGAVIIFVRTIDGRWMPLDEKPEKKPTVDKKTGIIQMVDIYTPHFVTCTNPERFRRK